MEAMTATTSWVAFVSGITLSESGERRIEWPIANRYDFLALF